MCCSGVLPGPMNGQAAIEGGSGTRQVESQLPWGSNEAKEEGPAGRTTLRGKYGATALRSLAGTSHIGMPF